MKKSGFLGIITFVAVCTFMLTVCSTDPDENSKPSTPSRLAATATSASSITVSWPAVSGALQYYVYHSSSEYGNFSRLGITVATSSKVYSYTASNLTSGTTHYFKVSAFNHKGESSQSKAVSASTPMSAPSTPTNVSAAASSASGITVNWSEVSGATGYNVYSNSSSTGTYSLAGSTSSTSYTVTGLSSNTTYYFRVSAYNSIGESSQASYVSARTL